MTGLPFLTPLQVAALAAAAGEGPLLLFAGLSLLAGRLARDELYQGPEGNAERGGFGRLALVIAAIPAAAGILIPYLLYDRCVVARFGAEVAITVFKPYLLLFPAIWPVVIGGLFARTLAAALGALRDHGHTRRAWEAADQRAGAPRHFVALIALTVGLFHLAMATIPLSSTLAIHPDRVVADRMFGPAEAFTYTEVASITVQYRKLTRHAGMMRSYRIAFKREAKFWDTDPAPAFLRARLEALVRPQLDLVAGRARIGISEPRP